MPSYRMCTSDGPITLTPGLAQHLQTILLKRAELERSSMWLLARETDSELWFLHAHCTFRCESFLFSPSVSPTPSLGYAQVRYVVDLFIDVKCNDIDFEIYLFWHLRKWITIYGNHFRITDITRHLPSARYACRHSWIFSTVLSLSCTSASQLVIQEFSSAY